MFSRHTVRDFFLSVTRNPFTARLTEACSEALWVGLSLWVGTSTFLRLTPNVGLVFFQVLTLFNAQQPLVLLTLLNNVHVRQPAKIASSLCSK